MPSDRESDRADRHATGDGPTAEPTPAAPGKRLARGLEHVSHLFLSESLAQSPAPGQTPPAPSASPLPDAHGLVLLDPHASVSRDGLVRLLRDNAVALEEGMRVVDENVPCEECGWIDLLAVDRAERLCVIDVAVAAEDALLVRAASHLDWVARNMLNVRRMYPGVGTSFLLPPRLVLVAPQFSCALRRAARQLDAERAELVKYHAVSTRSGVGVFLEAVRGW